MKLNEMYPHFGKLSKANQTCFISNLRHRREKYYAEFAMKQEKLAEKKKKTKLTRTKTREILLDPEKEKLILQLFGEKGLKRARKGLPPQ